MRQAFIYFKNAYDSVSREFLYNILIEFSFIVKLLRIIKMLTNESYRNVRVDKHVSEFMFPIKSNFKYCAYAMTLSLD